MATQSPLDNIFESFQDHWVEYGLLPLSTFIACFGGANALWAAVVGHTSGMPTYIVLPYLLLATAFSVLLTPVYVTGRVDCPGRLPEFIFLIVIPLVWHWALRLLHSLLPATGGQLASGYLLFLFGMATWVIGWSLSRLLSYTWPPFDRQSRIDWLSSQKNKTAPNLLRTEEFKKELEISQARMAKAESARIPYVLISLFVSAIIVVTSVILKDSIPAPMGFWCWTIFHGIGVLSSIATYNLALRRMGWSIHKTVVEPSVLRAWVVIGTITFALILPLSTGTQKLTRTVQELGTRYNIVSNTDDSKVVESKTEKRVAAHISAVVDKTKAKPETKQQTKTKKIKLNEKSKTITPPKAIQALWNLLASIIALGFIITSVLMGLSLAVGLLLVLTRILPGLGSALGSIFGTGSAGMTVSQVMMWPFKAVGELLTSGTRELWSAINRIARRGFSDNSSALRILGTANRSPINRLRQIRKERAIKAGYNESDPAQAIRYQYHQVLARAKRKGLIAGKSETPREMTAKIAHPPHLRDDVETLTSVYESIRYARPGQSDQTFVGKVKTWARNIIKGMKPRKS